MNNQRVYRLSTLANSKVRTKGSDEIVVREGVVPVSPPTIWRWIKEGKFPPPFKLSANVTVWDASTVDAWLANRRGCSQ